MSARPSCSHQSIPNPPPQPPKNVPDKIGDIGPSAIQLLRLQLDIQKTIENITPFEQTLPYQNILINRLLIDCVKFILSANGLIRAHYTDNFEIYAQTMNNILHLLETINPDFPYCECLPWQVAKYQATPPTHPPAPPQL
ncbi:unnamed protein product [Allacma fusca]|uniref:Uncharacterized protein n=1 Tax=Allacma fusca TaxID=39272 RepID=A0A8J2NWZ0_9HEXA|nr:unnamed protein product [Allacma fusca]